MSITLPAPVQGYIAASNADHPYDPPDHTARIRIEGVR
jgi:hypothetical protein